MASHRAATLHDRDYVDPNPLPSTVPHVDELGTTSAPLKSASFFIGDHCKAVNGEYSVCLEASEEVRTCVRSGTRNWFGKCLERCRDDYELQRFRQSVGASLARVAWSRTVSPSLPLTSHVRLS